MTTPDGLVAPTPTRERFVDSVPLGMCVLDERGCILQVSPGLLGSLGFRPEQLIGQAFGRCCLMACVWLLCVAIGS